MGISDRVFLVMFSPLVLSYLYFLYISLFWFIATPTEPEKFLC